MCENNQMMQASRQASVLQMEEERLQRIRQDSLEQSEHIPGVLEEHKALTPYASARIEREMRNGPPPGLSKAEKRRWKNRMQGLLEESRKRESFFAPVNRMMDDAEQRLMELRAGERDGFDESCQVLENARWEASVEENSLLRDEAVLRDHPEIAELQTMFQQLSRAGASIGSDRLVELTQRYRALGKAGSAGAANSVSYRHLKDAMRFSNPKAGYVFLLHCVATMLVYQLDSLPADQVNAAAFTRLYALASVSGVVASHMALSREFERQKALYQTKRQQVQIDVEQQQRELQEMIAARREYLRTGVGENGAPEVWIPQNLLGEAEAYLYAQGVMQNPTLSMQEFMDWANAIEASVRWNRETITARLEQEHGIQAPALRGRLLESIEQQHPRMLFRAAYGEINNSIREAMENLSGDLARYRERAEYLAVQPSLAQFPQLFQSPVLQTLPGAELSDEQFREQADLLAGQVEHSVACARSILRDALSPASRKAVLELLVNRYGSLFLHGSPEEIRELVRHSLRDDVLQELAPQVAEREESIRAAMDAAHLDPAWRTIAYRTMTEEEQADEALIPKMERLQQTAFANQEEFQRLFGDRTHTVPQWRELLQWMGEHAAQTPEEFLAQAQELASRTSLSDGQDAMTLEEYRSGGQRAQKIEPDTAGSYRSLLRGPMLCQWDGFLGYLDGHEEDVMQALERVLIEEKLDLPFLEDVNSLLELETLSYAEFRTLSSTLRGNLAETIEGWHTLRGEYASQVQKALLPDMLTGALKRENFRARAQKEERRFQNEAQALEIRFLAVLSGAQVQQPGELQYQHTDDTASTAHFSSKSRAERRLERFRLAHSVWQVLERSGLTKEAIENALEAGSDSGSGAKLHRRLCRLLEPLSDPQAKEVLRAIRKEGKDGYVNEFRLGGLEEFLLAKENNEEAYQAFTAGKQEVYKDTLRTLGSQILPRLQELEQVIGEYPLEESADYRIRMRPLAAGLREGSEEENRERFGVRSWQEALGGLRQYLRRQSASRAAREQAVGSAPDAQTALEYRREWMARYENGLFRPMVPLLMQDKDLWQSLSTDDPVAFETYAKEIFQRMEKPMKLLRLRFSFGEEFQRELVRELGQRILYGPERDLDGWMEEFNRFFDQYSRHTVGGASVEARYQKLREKDPEMANYLTEMILHDPQGISLLEDEEKWNAALKSCKKRVAPNTKSLKKYLSSMKKTGWKPTKAEQVSLDMFLRHHILFSEPDVFQESLSGWVQDFLKLRRESIAQMNRSIVVMGRRAEVLRDVERRRSEGMREDRRDLEELHALRGQLRAAGSPLLAALGVRKAPSEKQITEARYTLWEYRERPQRVKEILFERILSGVDSETLHREAAWLTALNKRIFSIPFYATEGERERFHAMKRVFEQMGVSWRTPDHVELSDRVQSEFLLYLYLHHRGENLTEEQLLEAFQSLGERHVLMGELLEQKNAAELDRHVNLYGAHTHTGQTAWNRDSLGQMARLDESPLEAERRNITEAMAIGMYTMEDSAFREAVAHHADYLQAAESAEKVFDPILKELVENGDERRQLRVGLQEYFHADLLGGSAGVDLSELRSRVRDMLQDPDYRQILRSSGSLLGSVSDTSLSGREKTAHMVASRETLEEFLAEKNNRKYCREYNALNIQQRQVFALSVLQSDRIGGATPLPSVTYVRSDDLAQSRMLFVAGQLETYASHGDFQPEIPYDRVMEVLRRSNGKMDAQAFESAMRLTRAMIRRYQEKIPRDWSRLSDGAYLIREARRLARKKEAAAGQGEQPPVTSLAELRERILAQDPGAAGTDAIKERLAALDDHTFRIVAAALEDRTVLDPTTRTAEENGEAQRTEYVNEQKRAGLMARFLGQQEEPSALRMHSTRLTRAMNGLMSHQLRDDVDLTGRALTRSDFAPKALSRGTAADWALLERAMDFADEVLREDLRRGAGLPQEESPVPEEEAEEQLQNVPQETQAEEDAVQENTVQEQTAAQQEQTAAQQEQPVEEIAEEITEETREQRRQTLQRRLEGMRNLPVLERFSTEQILSVKNIQENLEQMDEDAFVVKAASLLKNAESNLAQLRTILSERGALSLLDRSEAENRVISRFGGELLGSPLNSRTIEARVRAAMDPPAQPMKSFQETNREFIVQIRERMKRESLEHKPFTGAQEAETPEDVQRMERIGQALETLRGMDGLNETEQWLVLHCEEGIADYLDSAAQYLKEATVEEMIGWVRDTARTVEKNRTILNELAGKLYVFGSSPEWQEAIGNLAAKNLGADMLIECTSESVTTFMKVLEKIANETLNLADVPGRMLSTLQRDESVKRIPDLEKMPEVIACLFQDHSGGKGYSEMQELRTRIQHNVRILERVVEELFDDYDEQEEAMNRVLEERGRLLAWRTCSSEVIREMIRQTKA